MFSRNVLKIEILFHNRFWLSAFIVPVFTFSLLLEFKFEKIQVGSSTLSIASRSKQCRICWSWREQTVWVGECWGFENLSKTISLQFAMFTCLRWMSLQVSCFCKSRSLTSMEFKWTINQTRWSMLNPPAVDLPLELSVHLAEPHALPQLHVKQLLAEPWAPLVRVQETVIVHPGVIHAS